MILDCCRLCELLSRGQDSYIYHSLLLLFRQGPLGRQKAHMVCALCVSHGDLHQILVSYVVSIANRASVHCYLEFGVQNLI
jgi:hypothetical protein